MRRALKTIGWSVCGLALAAVTAAPAAAQVVFVPEPVAVAPPPVVTTFAAPAVVPSISYAVPAHSYYAAPAAAYSFYPSTTVYSAPVAVPAGSVTTRTYQGFGIFRPRGTYTESYYTPPGRR